MYLKTFYTESNLFISSWRVSLGIVMTMRRHRRFIALILKITKHVWVINRHVSKTISNSSAKFCSYVRNIIRWYNVITIQYFRIEIQKKILLRYIVHLVLEEQKKKSLSPENEFRILTVLNGISLLDTYLLCSMYYRQLYFLLILNIVFLVYTVITKFHFWFPF